MSFIVVENVLNNANSSKDVFGDLPGDVEQQRQALQKQFNKLAKLVHPDKVEPIHKITAEKVFILLQQWKNRAEDELRNGCYGTVKEILITTKRQKYKIIPSDLNGDLADLFVGRKESDVTSDLLFKIAKDKRNNDLFLAENYVLGAIAKYNDNESIKKIFDNHCPHIVDSFDVDGRQCNVIKKKNGFRTLEYVYGAYSHGIPVKAMAWMFNRMLSALGAVHVLGHVHGCVNLSNFMIEPDTHNGFLIDFCYSTKIGGKIKAIVPKYKNYYPPEVLAKREVGPFTDIYMAAVCMLVLLGGNINQKTFPGCVPKHIQYFLKSCLIENPNRRPNNAFDLHSEFRDTLKELGWNLKEFVPFDLK